MVESELETLNFLLLVKAVSKIYQPAPTLETYHISGLNGQKHKTQVKFVIFSFTFMFFFHIIRNKFQYYFFFCT